jgi:hypothetical protein
MPIVHYHIIYIFQNLLCILCAAMPSYYAIIWTTVGVRGGIIEGPLLPQVKWLFFGLAQFAWPDMNFARMARCLANIDQSQSESHFPHKFGARVNVLFITKAKKSSAHQVLIKH